MERKAAGLETALRRRAALDGAARAMAVACVISAAAGAMGIGAALWALASKPEPRYFATRTSGELVELTPLDLPHLADSQVVNFAVDAMTRAFSLDFANWRRELAELAPFFTEGGYEAFVAEMRESGTLDLITQRRMVSSAAANGGIILAKGLGGGGRYAWRVEVPLTVTYQSASEQQTQRSVMILEITRVPTWTSDWGIGIVRVVGQARR